MSDLDSEINTIINQELKNLKDYVKEKKPKIKKPKDLPVKPVSIPTKPVSIPTKPIENKKTVNDYVIVGGGPTGLSLAWYLGKIGKKVLIIEKETTLGGCHRVQRVNGLFSEHGPRVYSNSYLNFIEILEEMGIKFDDIFTSYNFDISNIGKKTILDLKFYEMFSFIITFIQLALNPDFGKNITMRSHMKRFLFTDESIDYVDRLCRLTDGATVDNYTLFQFLQLINQQFSYGLHQPKLPNDKGLFKIWEEKLLNYKNIDIVLNQDVLKINNLGNKISSLTVMDRESKNTYEIIGNNFILAIPPRPIVSILNNSPIVEVKNAFGKIEDMFKWTKNNSYFDYLPITLHFKNKIDLPKIWGFPSSDWGIAFIFLSDYMKFSDPTELENSKVVISTCITYPERKSKRLNKTAHECELNEVYDELIFQLREIFPTLPVPEKMILSPQVYKDTKINKWVNYDTAYVLTNENSHIPYESQIFTNLYNCGTHNGNSNYYFTSMESAVSNAKMLVNKLEPIDFKMKLNNTRNITNYLYFLILIFISYIFVRNFAIY
jgi:hypothetical protein